MPSRRFLECAVTAALAAVAAAFFADSLSLPAPRFDPLGPGMVPRAVAAILFGLCALRLLVWVWQQTAAGKAARPGLPAGEPGTAVRTTAARQMIILVLLALYVAFLEMRLIPFWIPTSVLLIAMAGFLAGWAPMAMAKRGIGLIAISFCLQVALTRLFFVNI